MAAKVPNSIGDVERVVKGSVSSWYLIFAATTLDDGDTVDLSPYLSSVIDAVFHPTTAVAVGRVLSGNGNTTYTHKGAGAGLAGILEITGLP